MNILRNQSGKIKKPFFLLSFLFIFSIKTSFAQAFKFYHDYSKTLVMKMVLAIPDGKGGSNVYCNFETALDLIKKADQLTLQVPKIIYLVGWQYNGHDDKYPAFFKVNDALKRGEDSSALESLKWLMREAKKYHTTISFHINMTDAYEDSPLWSTYVKNDLISKNCGGSLMVIGNYNHKKAYQVNYKNEWDSGWAQKRIDSLIKLIPGLKTAGTIHLDAWIARDSKGYGESAITEAEYQKKIARYWHNKGIDVTSEWVMDYMTGFIPYYWHFNYRTAEEYLKVPANVCTGGSINPDVKCSDFGLEFLFGQSMYGEPLWPNAIKNQTSNKDWYKAFAKKFYLNCLQYFFLNKLKRISVSGEGDNRVAFFSNGVNVSLKDSTVAQGEDILREKNTVFFPVVWRDKCIAAYSERGTHLKYFNLPTSWNAYKFVNLYNVTIEGTVFVEKIKIKNHTVLLSLSPDQPYLLKPTNEKE